jgi:hypothetical protein
MRRYPGTTLTADRLYALLPQWGFPEDVLVSTVVADTGADQRHVEKLVVQLHEQGLVDADLGLGYAAPGYPPPTVIQAP